jgi:hypothetical protein
MLDNTAMNHADNKYKDVSAESSVNTRKNQAVTGSAKDGDNNEIKNS